MESVFTGAEVQCHGLLARSAHQAKAGRVQIRERKERARVAGVPNIIEDDECSLVAEALTEAVVGSNFGGVIPAAVPENAASSPIAATMFESSASEAIALAISEKRGSSKVRILMSRGASNTTVSIRSFMIVCRIVARGRSTAPSARRSSGGGWPALI